jgi:hypothetical protein
VPFVGQDRSMARTMCVLRPPSHVMPDTRLNRADIGGDGIAEVCIRRFLLDKSRFAGRN